MTMEPFKGGRVITASPASKFQGSFGVRLENDIVIRKGGTRSSRPRGGGIPLEAEESKPEHAT